MWFKRPIALVGILLACLLPGLALAQTPVFVPGLLDPGPPLAGTNTVSNVQLQQKPNGQWTVSFDYFFTGAPIDTTIVVEQMASSGIQNQAPTPLPSLPVTPQRGQHRMTRDVERPPQDNLRFTREIHVQLRRAINREVVATATIASAIEWPDGETMSLRADLATIGVDGIVKREALLIDTEDSRALDMARSTLEKLIEMEPRADAAYLELARVAMKTNWSAEGLREAESLVKSAAQIRPDSANARILLGYVFANQKRFAEAEAEFKRAAAANPPNLWLWTNWGEMLEMQDREDAAIEKYREAVKRPSTGDTYDRARQLAYRHLFQLLGSRKDVAGAEALHMQRVKEYSGAFCSGVDYALFLVQQRGDAAAAIAQARDTAPSLCETKKSRETLGLAYYLGWAKGIGPDAESMVHRARVFFPAGPRLFYSLASSDATMPAAKRLVASGEGVDQLDGMQMNALAYALGNHDADVARRLLALGARSDTLVSRDKIPVAFVPLVERDVEGILVMKQAGVDYGKLRHEGRSAMEIARLMGDAALMKALDPKSGSL